MQNERREAIEGGGKKMRAKILPLNGKYYGTEIRIDHPNGMFHIKVWFMGDYKPSIRELRQYAKDENPEFCDSHYETKDTYEFCQRIVKLINRNMLDIKVEKRK